MNLFDVRTLAYVLHELTQSEMGFILSKLTGSGSKPPEDFQLEKAKKALQFADNFFHIHPLEDCREYVAHAKAQWERPMIDNSAACEIFHRLQVDTLSALKAKVFLEVAKDRSEFIEKDQLFGSRVHEAFHSARADIKEVGNCLAAECNTGAVFHLMRSSEIALRALARDRNVAFKDKPLEQKEWGQILGALEEIVKDLRLGDGKRWADPIVRETQITFYNEVLQELRGFNEAWRRHLSHAHVDSLYDRDYAMSVFKHVRTFMQKLACKISEDGTTPEFWVRM